MTPTVEQLEKALLTMAKLVSSREDGEAYLPICQRLEAEISKLRSAQSYLEHIKEMVSSHMA
ncbi:MAG: hypothetical protein ACU0A8_17325 [Limimaricola soesokkakensis]|uniref:hypothetical protein n=1 Tax=Limimaricola soesokkakensis TaxID=1343159 RepID=UPI00405A3882